MTNLDDLKVHIGRLAPDRWLAATGSAPYFCLEAKTEEEVVKLAARAIRFYQKTIAANGGVMPTSDASVGAPHFTRTIQARELIAA